MVFRFLLVVAVVAGALGCGAQPGFARMRMRVPSVVSGGEVVVVRGRAPRWVQVVLQARLRGRWVTVAHAVRRGTGGFAVRWRAPRRRAVVRLRVAALRVGRVVGVSAVRRVAVTPTSVLDASKVVAAPAPGAAGTVRYRGSARVRVGEFVAADVSRATPSGLLARVVGVRREGEGLVARVVPVSLVEAVPAGRLGVSGAVGATLRKAGAPRKDFRSAFSCGVGASLTGSLSLAVVPRLELDWSWGEVRSALAAVTLRGLARLEARIGGVGHCELAETPLVSWDGPPLRAFVGPIPVVVVPRTTLYVSGEASASAGAAKAAVEGHVSATAGLRWDGAVHPIGSFRHRLSAARPEVRSDASVAARVTPSVAFLLYGQAGPRFNVSAGLQLDAAADRKPWWKLTAPIELSAGLALPGLAGITIPQVTVFSRSLLLAQADTGPDGAGSGDGSDGGLGSGSGSPSAPDHGRERARIAWNTSATDVDLHVWDSAGHHAWFRDPTAIPDGTLSEDDRHGFGPELFQDSTPGAGRSLTYGLCYFDDSGAGPTDVSVRITDPGGTVRDSRVTLAHEGDHLLIGSSPPGAGFVPAGGWCDP